MIHPTELMTLCYRRSCPRLELPCGSAPAAPSLITKFNSSPTLHWEGRSYLFGHIGRDTYLHAATSGSHAPSLALSCTCLIDMVAGLAGKVLPVLGLLRRRRRVGTPHCWKEGPCSDDVQGYDSAEDKCTYFTSSSEHHTEREVRCHDTRRSRRSEALRLI